MGRDEVVTEDGTDEGSRAGWGALAVLGAAQFLMVIDTSVMNVSISTLVEDFDTEVTTIQGVITVYSLVMAALMVTGGKLGDIWGRRRAFAIGLAIYGVGSLTTSLAPTVGVLLVGWSILEGVGAALVMPALAALVAGSYVGRQRAVAYGVIGGIAGAAVAVGPIIGGWVTTNLTWRLVFAVEVLIVLAILATLRRVAEPPPAPATHLDVPGAAMSAVGLALVVLGALQSSSWGWVAPRSSPIEPLGFALTPFVIGAGAVVLALFAGRQRRLEDGGGSPLVRPSLLRLPVLRAGLVTLTGQQLVLMGVFFVIPLYLQVVQGLDAFETGVRMLPVSVAILVASLAGTRLSRTLAPRLVVRVGFGLVLAGAVLLLATIEPDLAGAAFAGSLAVLGLGVGLLASQLGAVLQGAVGEADRGEVGGLQYTGQNLGSALGTALVGAIVLGGLVTGFTDLVEDDERISDAVAQQASDSLTASRAFIPLPAVEAAVADAGLSGEEAAAVVDDYAQAQLWALKAGLLAAAAIALAVLWPTRSLPGEVPDAAAPPAT